MQALSKVLVPGCRKSLGVSWMSPPWTLERDVLRRVHQRQSSGICCCSAKVSRRARLGGRPMLANLDEPRMAGGSVTPKIVRWSGATHAPPS